jgi:Hemerythrin HHE cation binding domain
VSTGDVELTGVISADHRAIAGAMTALDSHGAGHGSGEQLTDHVVGLWMAHAAAEKRCLYPTVRRVLPQGDQLAARALTTHVEVERLIKALVRGGRASPASDEQMKELAQAVRHHIEETENQLLPPIQATCPQEELRALGEEMLKAKEMAPTRPHPSAPQRPPASAIVAPWLRLVDRVRDVLRGRTD